MSARTSAKVIQPQTGQVKYFYRRKEAATALGASLRRVDYWIADKTLTTRRIGGTVVIPAADVAGLAEKILKGEGLPDVAIGCN